MADDLLARIEADRAVALKRREAMRERFPVAAEMMDMFRAGDAALAPGEIPFNAKPVFAQNAQGETWGAPPKPIGLAVDGDKLARLPGYEAFWRKSLGKRAETNATYRERMQRAIKPGTGIE